MKNLYVAHVVAMLILLVFGLYFGDREQEFKLAELMSLDIDIEELNWLPSRKYGVISLFCFGFSIVLGYNTMNRLRKTGSLLFLGGIVFFAWSCLMISSPKHISIDEVFIAWMIYIIVMIICSVIGFAKIDSAPIIKDHFEDELLDD